MLDLPGYSTVDQTLYIDLRGTTALLEKKTDWEWQFKQVNLPSGNNYNKKLSH